MLLEKVGEEEYLEDGEDDEKLDEDDGPQGTAQRHFAETVVVEVVDPIEKVVFFHRPVIKDFGLQIYIKM